MVLYADILFLVDLSMDFLTLFLCSRLSHRPVTLLRALAASALGALGSVVLVAVGAGRGMTFWCGIGLSCLMTAAAFGVKPSVRSYVRQVLLVWGSGAVAGGCMSVLMSLGEPVYLETGRGGQASFGMVFLGTTAAVYCLIRLLQKKTAAGRAEITIVYRGVTAKVPVLVDSGNLLTDPLTGRPVILVSRAAAAPLLLPDGTERGGTGWAEKILPVPASGISGTRLLWGVRPDLLLVNGQPRDALVAAENTAADHYGGFGGTCSPVLL